MAMFDAKDTKHDVFISYTTDDNKYYEDYIHDFRDDLIDKMSSSPILKDLGGRNPKIFIDTESLTRTGDISKALQQAINESMFLVLMVTRNYLDSKWCFNELEYFRKRFKGKRSQAFERTFIMVLEKEALPPERPWPESQFGAELPKYTHFYDQSNQEEAGPCRRKHNGEVNNEYHRELRRMAQTMGELYRDTIRDRPPAHFAPPEPDSHAERSEALLGVVSQDLIAARGRLRAMLEEKDISATLLEPADLTDTNRIEAWQARINPSMVFIQLVSYARPEFDGLNDYGHLGIQASRLGDLGECQPREMVWCHPADEPDVVTDDLSGDTNTTVVDYVRAKLEDEASCASLQEVITRIAGDGELAETRKVYVESNELDEEEVWKLTDQLTKKWKQRYGQDRKVKFRPMAWKFGLADRAAQCQGIILVYGKKEQEALEAQVDDIERVLDTLQDDQDPPRQWIALAPPHHEKKGTLFWRTFSINEDGDIEKVINDIHGAIA